MRRIGARIAGLLALVLAVAPLSAQRGQGLPAGPGRDALEAQILEQFMNRYQRQAALTPDQNERFRAALLRSVQVRKDLQQRERTAWQALEFQMRPGVAANPDSVTKLLDAVFAARQAVLDQTKAEQHDYAAYLNPVQRAQLAIEWEQFLNRIDQMIRNRQLGRSQGQVKN